MTAIAPGRTLAAMLWLAALPLAADLCKWVDEDGCVHYAETCPPGVEGTAVETAPPPSQEQLDAAVRRAEEMLQQRHTRKTQTEAEQAQADAALQKARSSARARDQACETAFAERQILAIDLPIYRDDQGGLHHKESLHDYLYQGERRYLADAERSRALGEANAFYAAQCRGFEPATRNYVYRFRRQPTTTELLGLLQDMPDPAGPPGGDLCAFAKIAQQELRDWSTGIPSDNQRELDRLIGERCR